MDIISSINGYRPLKAWHGHPTILSLFICKLGESPCFTPLGGFWGLCSVKSNSTQNTWATTMNESMSNEALQITLAQGFTSTLCYAEPLTSLS